MNHTHLTDKRQVPSGSKRLDHGRLSLARAPAESLSDYEARYRNHIWECIKTGRIPVERVAGLAGANLVTSGDRDAGSVQVSIARKAGTWALREMSRQLPLIEDGPPQ